MMVWIVEQFQFYNTKKKIKTRDKSGARRNYEFELDFYDHVDRGFAMRVGPTTVQLLVRKDRETCYMWKSLTKGRG